MGIKEPMLASLFLKHKGMKIKAIELRIKNINVQKTAWIVKN
jgi:hypothetical protein